MLSTEDIARVCHEANRAFCEGIGDQSQLPYDEAPEWQRTSAVNGVNAILSGKTTTPAASHDSWMQEKLATGWRYGETKDANQKTHPCLVPFSELPHEQRIKDILFYAIVDLLWPLHNGEPS